MGERQPFGRLVWVEDGPVRRLLPFRGADTTAGYAWGRAGAKPRDLARSLLCHALGSEVLAERLCREFACEVVVTLPWEEFRLPQARVTS